jgi:hypothetical protein
MLAKPVFYCFSHSTDPFCSDYLVDMVSLFAQKSLDHHPPIFASAVDEMTGMYHHTQCQVIS